MMTHTTNREATMTAPVPPPPQQRRATASSYNPYAAALAGLAIVVALVGAITVAMNQPGYLEDGPTGGEFAGYIILGSSVLIGALWLVVMAVTWRPREVPRR
jgi:hypothetical protein